MQNSSIVKYFFKKFDAPIFNNSLWGVLSNILQNIFFSVFFIVIARKYNISDFSNYIIANTLYGFVLAFSSLGLGQWFIREMIYTKDKISLISQFFKIQLIAGVVFYLINIVLSYLLYKNDLIRTLSLLVGVNIIFDNIIYVIKFINIAELQQKRTFLILTIESVLKLIIACMLFFYKIPIIYLAFFLIALRLFTLNLFLRIGNKYLTSFHQIVFTGFKTFQIKKIVLENWVFIIIGSIAVIYWKVGNLIVSKFLSLIDVAHYEISFKLFALAQIIPVIVSTTVFPILVKLATGNLELFVNYYRKIYIAYAIYGLLAYTFIYSFSDFLIPFLFGDKFTTTSMYCKEMFFTILIFPTALLQANVLIALKRERVDMWLNIVSLLLNSLICVFGLLTFKSLSVVNFAVFVSFLLFHLLQDIILVRLKITKFVDIFIFFSIGIILVLSYHFLAGYISPISLFILFWTVLIVIISYLYYIKYSPSKLLTIPVK